MGWYRGGESNSQGYSPADFESAASTNSATPAQTADCKRLRCSGKGSDKSLKLRPCWYAEQFLHGYAGGDQAVVCAAGHHQL